MPSLFHNLKSCWIYLIKPEPTLLLIVRKYVGYDKKIWVRHDIPTWDQILAFLNPTLGLNTKFSKHDTPKICIRCDKGALTTSENPNHAYSAST